MTRATVLTTDRLVLRRWRDADRAPFAAMNADPAVVEHLVAPLTRVQSDALVDRAEAAFVADGFGLWAVELRSSPPGPLEPGPVEAGTVEAGTVEAGTVETSSTGSGGSGAFVGFVGLARPRFEAAFTPAVEVGWRLARPYWGLGLATEGGHAALAYGMEVVGLTEIVSFTAVRNVRSQRVMQHLGMVRDPAEDFDHPAPAPESPLRRHVLYRLTAARWRRRPGSAPAAPGTGSGDRSGQQRPQGARTIDMPPSP